MSDTVTDLSCFILAGGSNSRFGSDKARAEVDGQPLILKLARSAEAFASEIVVVADCADKYADLGLRTIADEIPARGPLGGLYTALQSVAGPAWLLVASCDLLQLTRDSIEPLLAAVSPDVQAIAYRGRAAHPFPALYHTSLADLVQQRIAQQQLAMRGLLEQARCGFVALDDDAPALRQANTPADLTR